jgi:cytosine/adenosine deaminase-related metal-dependent hydrolase
MTCDILIEGGAVVTMDRGWRVFDPGYIAISGGSIVGVGPSDGPSVGFAATDSGTVGFTATGPDTNGSSTPEVKLAGMLPPHDAAADSPPCSAFEPARRIDARGRLVLPGFVNTHTHVPMAAFRSAGDDVRDRLLRYIFPMERLLVDADLVYRSSRYCLAEMLCSGTTTFADMYYFEEEVARAAKEAGMRALLGQTVVDFPAPDAAEPYGGIERARRFAADWAGDSLVSACVAPHATYTVDAEHLAMLRRESERLGTPMMMHIAETADEAARFKASHGSVVRYLDSIGLLWPGLLAVHAVFVDEDDARLLAERGAAVAHCPASNAKAGRPIAPARMLAEAGVRLGLGTDGPISGNGMDMQGITGLYPKLQKVLAGRRDVLSAKEALRAATLGGAEALGIADRTGSVETGKRADLQIVDAQSWTVQPVYDWYSAAVYGMRPHDVRTVLVDGRVVLDERRVTGFDEDEVKADMRAIAARCSGEIARLSRAAL